MQATKINEKAMLAEAKMLNAKKMVVSEMLKYGYHPKIGLGPRVNGIVEPIQLKQQKGTIGLGYEPIYGASYSKGFGMRIFVRAQVLVSEQTNDEHITKGIGNLFMDVIEEESEMAFHNLTIRDAEPGVALQNWPISPSLFC
ncbi:hypothetical protein FXO38_36343 [Capsicum annuum]|uniref:G-patch domain-containing protein n=1 Tax=Capsicum annuum TaxID=4072 RepID=A0A2G2ZY72_CAPAN|nr:hypothetical protein FXO38_36343 [Capsicum annuum]PHT86937.1 hypothetical protein T459_09043 [Capsicum annuum]